MKTFHLTRSKLVKHFVFKKNTIYKLTIVHLNSIYLYEFYVCCFCFGWNRQDKCNPSAKD